MMVAGLLVSVLTFNSDDPISNTTVVYSVLYKILFERNEKRIRS